MNFWNSEFFGISDLFGISELEIVWNFGIRNFSDFWNCDFCCGIVGIGFFFWDFGALYLVVALQASTDQPQKRQRVDVGTESQLGSIQASMKVFDIFLNIVQTLKRNPSC